MIYVSYKSVLFDERYALGGPLAREHPVRRRQPPRHVSRDTLVYTDKAITVIAARQITILAYCCFFDAMRNNSYYYGLVQKSTKAKSKYVLRCQCWDYQVLSTASIHITTTSMLYRREQRFYLPTEARRQPDQEIKLLVISV